ncbi:MAG: hypothetical protein ACI93N_000697 [Flavobacteriaceae bacterium]|jgi:hypothetical protein
MKNQPFKNLATLFLILLFVSYSAYSQSPWTQKKGEFYTQLGFSTIPNYTGIFGDPDYNTERKITDNTFQLYGEYGISDKTTLLLNVPFKNITSGDLSKPEENDIILTEEKNINAFGNVNLGVKHNFYDNKWLITGQLNVELNTSSYNEVSGIRTGYDSFTFTPQINAGRGFDKFYVQAFTGFAIRTNDYSSNFKIGGEAGAKILNRIWIVGFLDFVLSLENGDFIAPVENLLTGLYINDQEYTAYGLKIIGEITPEFGIIAGFGGAFSGTNVAKQAAYNFGLYYKIKNKN